MRWLLLLLLTVGLAGAAPPTIFGQAGLPDPFELINIILSGYLTVDSVDTQHLVVDVDATIDSTDTNHLVVNTTTEVKADAGILVGAATAGDADITLISAVESDNTETMIYNDGSTLFQFSTSILADVDVQAGVQFRVGSLRMRDDSIFTTGTAGLLIDPGGDGQATGTFGVQGDLDLFVFNTNLLTTGDGTVGDASVVMQADTGAGNVTIWEYDETDDQLEFTEPVQVAELDVVEAGDAITVGAWTRYLMIEAGGAALGPTAPAHVSVETIGALAFDADAEVVFITKEIPDDWNGTSDMSLKIYWTNEPADAIADTETVKFDISYRSLLWDTEDVDNNAAVAGTVTYTQSGAGNDGETFEHSITLDYDHGDQPLAAGDVICIQFDRDVTGDTYGGDAYVVQWEIVYTSVGLPNHN